MFRENAITELLSNRRNLIKLVIDLGTVFIGIFLGLLVRFEGNWIHNIHNGYFIVYGVAFLCFYIVRIKIERSLDGKTQKIYSWRTYGSSSIPNV